MVKAIDGVENCLIGYNRVGEKKEIVLVALFLTCSVCDGEGTVDENPCPECKGEGTVLDEHNDAVLDKYFKVRSRQTATEAEDEQEVSDFQKIPAEIIELLSMDLKGRPVEFTIKNRVVDDDRKISTVVGAWGIRGTADGPYFFLETRAMYWHEAVDGVNYNISETQLVLSGKIQQSIVTINLT